MKLIIILFIPFLSISQNQEKLFEQSIDKFNEGMLSEADSLISLAIKLDSLDRKEDYLKYYNRGIFRLNMDSINIAIIDFKKCTTLVKQYVPAIENLALCQYLSGNYIECVETTMKLVELAPISSDGYAIQALAYIELENWKELIRTSQKALTYGTSSQFIAFRIIGYSKIGQFDLANNEIEQSMKKIDQNDIDFLEARLVFEIETNKNYCKLYQIILNLKPDFLFLFSDNVRYKKLLNKCK